MELDGRSDPGEPPPSVLTRERRALEWCAAAALVAIAWLAMPLAAGLLLGTFTGFTMLPYYERLARRTGRPLLASVLTSLGTAIALIGAVAGFVSLFVSRAVAVMSSLIVELGPSGSITAWAHSVTGFLEKLGVSPEEVTGRIRDLATDVARDSANLAGAVASATASGVLGLFFAILAMHLILRNWNVIRTRLEVLSPLRREYTRALLEEFQRVGRTTLLGTVVTGAAQGVFATIGYAMTGVPEPLFFGIGTALASLVPGIGTLLVWVPAGIFLILSGHPARGVIELVWAAATVGGLCDYVLRPRLVGDEAMPALLTFVALFGGVEVFGLEGLVVGPVVMSIAVAVLRIYARDVESRRPRAD